VPPDPKFRDGPPAWSVAVPVFRWLAEGRSGARVSPRVGIGFHCPALGWCSRRGGEDVWSARIRQEDEPFEGACDLICPGPVGARRRTRRRPVVTTWTTAVNRRNRSRQGSQSTADATGRNDRPRVRQLTPRVRSSPRGRSPAKTKTSVCSPLLRHGSGKPTPQAAWAMPRTARRSRVSADGDKVRACQTR
jgi:hypothetical protein